MIGNNSFKSLCAYIKKKRSENSQDFFDYFLGQPHLKINPVVEEKIPEFLISLNKASLGYMPVQGRNETIEALQKLLKKSFKLLEPQVHHILCTHGATQANYNALSALITSGKTKVLCFSPYFPLFKDQVHRLNGLWIEIELKSQMKPDFKLLEKHLIEHKKQLEK